MENLSKRHWRYWALLALAVSVIKALIYWLNPTMMFFLGDSSSYLYSASTGWIPPDRSYDYGTFINIVTRNGRYLDALIPAQVAAGGLSCMVLGIILVRFLNCSRGVAAVAVLVCALEPIQLLYERYVMTENISLLVFSLFLFTLMVYLRKGVWWLLVPVAGLAMLTVSLRTAYLPAVGGTGLLAVLYHLVVTVVFPRDADIDVRRPVVKGGIVAAHLLAFALTFFLAYSWEASPRTTNDKGFFLLSAWGPVLAEDDYPLSPTMEKLVDDLPPICDLADINKRQINLWFGECLSGSIKTLFSDRNEANRFAAEEAFKALMYDPLRVFYLGFRTWAAVWDDGALSEILPIDRGARPAPSKDFAEQVLDFYDKDISGWNEKVTLTNQYYYSASAWYRLLSLMPLLMILWWWLSRRRLSPFSLVVVSPALLLLLTTSIPTTNSTVRFYHGIAWLALIAIGSSVNEAIAWRRRAGSRERLGNAQQ